MRNLCQRGLAHEEAEIIAGGLEHRQRLVDGRCQLLRRPLGLANMRPTPCLIRAHNSLARSSAAAARSATWPE